MIAPIKKTQRASGSSSQMGAKPLWACAGCRDADAGGLCVADRDGGVGVVEDEIGADVVGIGVVAVGVSGNC
jgi:hypothetical protein